MRRILNFLDDKLITFLLIIMASIICLWVYMINSSDAEMEFFVGKEVIINEDTTVIVNYSIWSDEYTLSSGAIVSKEYAENNLK